MHNWYWGVVIAAASLLIVAAILGSTHRSITRWVRKPPAKADLRGSAANIAAPLPLDVVHDVDEMTARELEEKQDSRSSVHS